MQVTLTQNQVERAIEAYVESPLSHMESCPLAQALQDAGLYSVTVSYEAALYRSPTDGKVCKRALSPQAIAFAEEFDEWFDEEYTEGRLGNFAGRTITVWEE